MHYITFLLRQDHDAIQVSLLFRKNDIYGQVRFVSIYLR
jgi:hypothetical protein